MSNVYLKSGRYVNERLDCTVIALSYAFELDYSYAHRLCKEKGRKDGHTFSLDKVLGSKKDYEYFVFKPREGRYVKYFGRPRMRVDTFRKTHPKGTYIIRISGHAFTIIDGVIYNNNRDKCIVKSYWCIKKEIE